LLAFNLAVISRSFFNGTWNSDTLTQLPQRRGKISSADEIFKIGDDVSRDVMAIGREGEEYFVFRGV